MRWGRWSCDAFGGWVGRAAPLGPFGSCVSGALRLAERLKSRPDKGRHLDLILFSFCMLMGNNVFGGCASSLSACF